MLEVVGGQAGGWILEQETLLNSLRVQALAWRQRSATAMRVARSGCIFVEWGGSCGVECRRDLWEW